jgi:hypothetical protein
VGAGREAGGVESVATDRELLAEIERAFEGAPRPEHFTSHTHCCECFEHDELLRSRDRETLGIGDVGSQSWDPICCLTPEGFAYYLPALARLALSAPDEHWGWYGDQLAFHLRYDGPRNARWEHCNPGQRRAVAKLLDHILETRAELADRDGCADALFEAREIWSER